MPKSPSKNHCRSRATPRAVLIRSSRSPACATNGRANGCSFPDGMGNFRRPVRIGIGGPVGSGKTMLVLRICQWLRDKLSIAVVTNDIYTREDAEFLVRNDALPAQRV